MQGSQIDMFTLDVIRDVHLPDDTTTPPVVYMSELSTESGYYRVPNDCMIKATEDSMTVCCCCCCAVLMM